MLHSSPNNSEKAFSLASSTSVEPTATIVPNENSPEALKIAENQGRVVHEFAGNWEAFFLAWKKEQDEGKKRLFEMNSKLYEQQQG